MCEDEPISDQDTEVESTVVGPGCTRDPSGVVGKDRAASLGTVGACQDTEAPLDNLHVGTRWVQAVFRMRHTWAPLGSWPWGSAGHHKVSCPSAAFSGRGNSRST